MQQLMENASDQGCNLDAAAHIYHPTRDNHCLLKKFMHFINQLHFLSENLDYFLTYIWMDNCFNFLFGASFPNQGTYIYYNRMSLQPLRPASYSKEN